MVFFGFTIRLKISNGTKPRQQGIRAQKIHVYLSKCYQYEKASKNSAKKRYQILKDEGKYIHILKSAGI